MNSINANGRARLFGFTFDALQSLEDKPIRLVRYQGRLYAAPSLIRELERAGTFARFRAILETTEGLNVDAMSEPEFLARSVDAAFPVFTHLQGPGKPATDLMGIQACRFTF